MLIGITGYRGRLGTYLLNHYDNFVGLDCDVTKPTEVDSCLEKSSVGLVLHLAAKSDVDYCQKKENFTKVSLVNFRGTYNVCQSTQRLGIDTVLLSTDHVFDGRWGNYTETSKQRPINNYGMTKFAAEGFQTVFDNLKVIRTSYLFDAERLDTHITKLIEGKSWQEYPTFIRRSFMYLPHFCNLLHAYFWNDYNNMPRMLHLSGSESVSWYQFMNKLSEVFGLENNIVPKRWETKGMVPRPHHAGLNTNLAYKLGFGKTSYTYGLEQMYKDNV